MLDIQVSQDGIAGRIEQIRRACSDLPAGAVLAESSSPIDVATLSIACWQDARRVVFPPTLREGMLEQVEQRYGCLRIDWGEMDPLDPEERTFRLEIASADMPAERELAEFFTSGSTGEPKRAIKCVRQLLGEARMLAERFEVGREDVLVSGVPANHLYGFLFSFVLPLVSGCRVAFSTPLHAESLASLCGALDATILVSTPAQLKTLTTVSADRFPDFKRLFSSGDALPARTRRELAASGLDVTEIFGSTETGGIAVRDKKRTRTWEPLPGVEIRAGDEGRMELRSRYTRQPDSFMLTDDRIELVDGGFRHKGRADSVVKVGGRRVSKLALSRRLEAHDAVEEAELLELVSDETDNLRLYGFIQSNTDVTARDLRTYLLQWFEPATIPRLHIVSELPSSSMGKVTRESLLELIDQMESSRKPTLSVSEPEEVGPDTFEVGFHVPEDSVYFDGHFPSLPILPGVVQVTEIALKQIGQVWPRLTEPTNVRRLKFLAPVMPNAELTLVLERDGSDVSFLIRSDEEELCKGAFCFPGEEDA